ncbi:MAG: DUF3488 domain-containing transglutaminase family protein [Gammaproteobacteria bacterium]|nr:DUF3488 domain-containing transglutaminase family protein [Gammaproteobacteria bacterium]
MSVRGDISIRDLAWCCAGITLALGPHLTRLPPLLPLCFFALLVWRLAGALGKARLPHRDYRLLWALTQLGALGVFVGVYAHYQGGMGRDAGVALLCGLVGLKLLEMKEARDFYVVCFLAYFLVVTHFFYSQAIVTAIYLFGVTVLITAALIRFNSPASIGDRACATLAARMVLESVPLMVFCFMLFPRLDGPLWGMPGKDDHGVTGLSDHMEIGRIAHLGTSDEVAFRVAFDGARPRARDLYWRGPVLWVTDGRRWDAGDVARGKGTVPVVARGPRYRYEILLEPHDERWLLGLDAVTATGERMRVSRALELTSLQRVKQRRRYTLESSTAYSLRDLSAEERTAALQLPPAAHPRTRALAAAWRAAGRDDRGVVAAALQRFAAAPYGYTLTPPTLSGDPIDGFLFDTRLGFCEHYAASFVVLLRAAGIPARVVTGYQGGEYNGVSDYMVVRQSDAHAWAEVWFDDEGWVRADPTAAVAPERVSLGIGEFSRAGAGIRALEDNDTALALLHNARQLWDAANYQWSQWVLGYSPQRQRELMERLGLGHLTAGRLIVTLLIVGVLLLAGLAWLLLRRPAQQGGPAVRAWHMCCRRLAQAGLPRAAHEGPLEFAARVAAARADLASDIEAIARLYALLRYADAPHGLETLRERVRAFRPGRAARPA